MIWSWDLSATLGWADGSKPGSWIQRLQTANLSTALGGNVSCGDPAGGPEHCARPLGSVFESHFPHVQNELALCDPGLLVTWQPKKWYSSDSDNGVNLHISQLLRRPSGV